VAGPLAIGALSGLDHVQVGAPPGSEADVRRFYGDLLGLSEAPKPPVLAARGGVWFTVGAQGLHVGVDSGHVAPARAHPALAAADDETLDVLAARLRDAGYPVEWDDAIPGVRRFYTRDPFGNRLELVARAG
jgi:catechol 2,3-dioxygenase-like lactoylglutathione lyase family enzyme